MSSTEYTNAGPSQAGWSYNTLSTYNNANNIMAPLTAGTTVCAQTIPQWGAIGYSALTHGVPPSGNKYFSIRDAYGANASNCSTQYLTRLCKGGGCGGK